MLSGRMTRLVTTNRIIRQPTSIVGRLIRGAVSTNTHRIAIRVGGNNIACVQVASSNYNVRQRSIPATFLHRTADGIHARRSLRTVNALNFHNRTLTSITTITGMSMLAYTLNRVRNARCIVRNKRRGLVRRTKYPRNAAFIIRSLFCGVPTHVGFLGGSIDRKGTITNIIRQLTLSRPDVTVHFVQSNHARVRAPNSNGLLGAVMTIFNGDFTSGLVPLSCTVRNVRISKFVYGPRKYQPGHAVRRFFIGGQCIGARATLVTVRHTCGKVVVIKHFPTYILFISLPPRAISTGIRPTGVRIQFVGRGPIFSTICCTIGSTLRTHDSVHRMRRHRRTFRPVGPTFMPSGPIIIGDSPPAVAPGITRMTPPPTPHCLSVTMSSGPLSAGPTLSLHSKASTPVPVNIPCMPGRGQRSAIPAGTTRTPTGVARPPIRRLAMSRRPSLHLLNRTFSACVLIRVKRDLCLVSGRTTRRHVLCGRLGRRRRASRRVLLTPVTIAIDQRRRTTLLSTLRRLRRTNVSLRSFNKRSMLMQSFPLILTKRSVRAAVQRVTNNLRGNSRRMAATGLS